MEKMTPALHPPIPIGARVSTELYEREITGHIGGISSAGIVFLYIVILDQPLLIPERDEVWEAITIPGGCLKLEGS